MRVPEYQISVSLFLTPLVSSLQPAHDRLPVTVQHQNRLEEWGWRLEVRLETVKWRLE
jgi:hypothetical protein